MILDESSELNREACLILKAFISFIFLQSKKFLFALKFLELPGLDSYAVEYG